MRSFEPAALHRMKGCGTRMVGSPEYETGSAFISRGRCLGIAAALGKSTFRNACIKGTKQ